MASKEKKSKEIRRTMSEWLEAASPALLALEERPQFGALEFPWKELERVLGIRFQKKEFNLVHQEKGWLIFEDLPQILKETTPLAIYVSGIKTPLFWFMSKEDVFALITPFFAGKAASSYFLEKPLYEGLCHFFALEVLSEIGHLPFAQHLSFHLGDLPAHFQEILNKEGLFEIDVLATNADFKIHGSLLIPASFRSAWKKTCAPLPTLFSKELTEKVEVDIALEIGHVSLSVEDFKEIKKGDFIFLDHCSYNPEEKEGWVALSLAGESIFRGRLKQEEIKLLEYPRLAKSGDEMEENFELVEEDIVGEKEEIAKEGPSSFIAKLPIQLVVEVARLKMTLDDVAKLSPGALLELPIAVEEGVDLVINGKKVGKGELMKMGEMMGVRITQL